MELLAWLSPGGRCDLLDRGDEVSRRVINLEGYIIRGEKHAFVLLLHDIVRFLKHRRLSHCIVPSSTLCSCTRPHLLLSRGRQYIDEYIVIALRVMWGGIAKVLHGVTVVGDHNLWQVLCLLHHRGHRLKLEVSAAYRTTKILQIVIGRDRSQELTRGRIRYTGSLHTYLLCVTI